MAEEFLREKGYIIMEKNWRHGHWEVDVIAARDETLHFIEIKTRKSIKFGFPEEDVSRKKIENLMGASEEYCLLHPRWKRIQFDILSIIMYPGKPAEFFLIEDVSL